MRRTLLTLAGLGLLTALVLGAVAFGPTLVRSDHLAWEWDGSLGENVLEEPIGIAALEGRLYVSDAARNRVVVLDTAGEVLDLWEGEEYGFRRPMSLHAGPDGLVYMAEYLADRVTVVDTAGEVARRVGGVEGDAPGELDAPGGAASLGDEVYVADFYNHRVQAFGPDEHVRVLGRPGRALPGRLHYPTDVAVSGDSVLYVADAYNNRVQALRPDGSPVARWGGPLGSGLPGGFRGWFRVATGVTVADDAVFVADFYNHRIQVFGLEGRYLGQVADSLRLPTASAVGDHGTVYVADFGNGRVARFRPRP